MTMAGETLRSPPLFSVRYSLIIAAHAPVAQLDRVLGYEPRGQEFESLRARHLIPQPTSSQDSAVTRGTLARTLLSIYIKCKLIFHYFVISPKGGNPELVE